MSTIWTTFFYQPVLNLVIFVYDFLPIQDLALTIIIFAVIVKLLLLPLSKKQLKSQKELQELQPKIEALKKQYKDDREALSRETLKLYQENKVNPFSSCGTLIIQLPFLIAVFRVFRDNFSESAMSLIYSFLPRPETINAVAFGIWDLASPNVFLAIAAGLAQFWQTKLMMAKKKKTETGAEKKPNQAEESFATTMNKQMMYMMPVLTVFIGLSLPGGLTLYWFVTTILTAFQQIFLFRQEKTNKDIQAAS